MKKLSLSALLILSLFGPMSHAAGTFVIITGAQASSCTIIPNDYMQAQSVTVELFDEKNNLLSCRTGMAGEEM